MAKAQQDLVDLCGYFMPDDKQDADDEDSDGDADEDFENLDFKQMTAVAEGAALIPSKPIGRKLGKKTKFQNKKKKKCCIANQLIWRISDFVYMVQYRPAEQFILNVSSISLKFDSCCYVN